MAQQQGKICFSVCQTMKELELPWMKLKGVTTDRAASMIGKKTGLMIRMREEMNKHNPKFYVKLQFILY